MPPHQEIFRFRLLHMSSPALSGHVQCISGTWFSLILYSYCNRYAIKFVGPGLRAYRLATPLAKQTIPAEQNKAEHVQVRRKQTKETVAQKSIFQQSEIRTPIHELVRSSGAKNRASVGGMARFLGPDKRQLYEQASINTNVFPALVSIFQRTALSSTFRHIGEELFKPQVNCKNRRCLHGNAVKF